MGPTLTAPDRPMPARRLDRLDALRGLAMVWMTVFHFCFDLSYLRVWPQDFYNDVFWTWQRSAIVGLFLLCAGLGQAAAHWQQVPLRRFLKRWAQVAGCALLVSAGSYAVFPQSYIYFGVLHGMAVMLLMLRGLHAVKTHWLWLLALLCVLTPWLYVAAAPALPASVVDALNAKPLDVLGLVTRKPRTEDYVPLLPWFGVMLTGFLLGGRALRAIALGHASALTTPVCSKLGTGLVWLGRHSLLYYMVHQLVLLGGLTLVVRSMH